MLVWIVTLSTEVIYHFHVKKAIKKSKVKGIYTQGAL
jgi:hypothetical protein